MINDENSVRNSGICEGLGNSVEYLENSLRVKKFPGGHFFLKCKFPGVENSLGFFINVKTSGGKNSHLKISVVIFEHTVNPISQNECH